MKDNFIFLISLSLCLLAIVAVNGVSHHQPVALSRPLKTIPLKLNGWQGKEAKLGERTLKVLRVDDYIFRTYVKGNRMLWVYVGYYMTQKKGALVHSPKHCYPGGGWEILKAEEVKIKLAPEYNLIANRLLLHKDLEKRLVVYWYQERGRIIANEYKAKIYLIADTILKHRSNGALIRISTRVKDSPEAAFELEKAFLKDFYPILNDYLPK